MDSPETFAVYDDFGKKRQGGFATEAEAEAWIEAHPGYRVFDWDDELQEEVETELDLQLLLREHEEEGWWYLPRPRRYDVILPEVL